MPTTASPLALAPGVSCCKVGERHLFLDQKADRYLALGLAEDKAVARLIAGAPPHPDDEIRLQALVGRGLLTFAPDGPRLQTCDAILAATALSPSPIDKISPITQLSFALRVMSARRYLKRSGLHECLKRLKDRKSRLSEREQNPAPTLREAANLLTRITQFTTRHDQCLPISLGLAHHLLHRAVSCDLLLGVQLGPFQAHCWVQHGNRLVGDDLDVVRTFTPILLV